MMAPQINLDACVLCTSKFGSQQDVHQFLLRGILYDVSHRKGLGKLAHKVKLLSPTYTTTNSSGKLHQCALVRRLWLGRFSGTLIRDSSWSQDQDVQDLSQLRGKGSRLLQVGTALGLWLV